MTAVLTCLFMPVLFSALISGCSKKTEYNETTISISKKGVITNEINESFNKNYYSQDELKSMIEKEIAAYDILTGEKDRVKLEGIRVENGRAKVTMIYNSFSDYADFNKVDFFYGTVNDALSEGFTLDVTMKSTVDGSNVNKDDIVKLGSSHIIIISEPVLVESLSDILYVTANVEVLDKRHGRMSSDSSGRAYMILK